jgi:hypothetical protein
MSKETDDMAMYYQQLHEARMGGIGVGAREEKQRIIKVLEDWYKGALKHDREAAQWIFFAIQLVRKEPNNE